MNYCEQDTQSRSGHNRPAPPSVLGCVEASPLPIPAALSRRNTLMRWTVLSLALTAMVGVNSAQAGLFDCLGNHGGCCKPEPACCCAAPTCCAPADDCCHAETNCCAPEPASCCKPQCCYPEPKCCAPAPKCCAPEPKCCAPEPECCAPQPGCCGHSAMREYHNPNRTVLDRVMNFEVRKNRWLARSLFDVY